MASQPSRRLSSSQTSVVFPELDVKPPTATIVGLIDSSQRARHLQHVGPRAAQVSPHTASRYKRRTSAGHQGNFRNEFLKKCLTVQSGLLYTQSSPDLRAETRDENGTEDDYETEHDEERASDRKVGRVAAVRPV
jgi:hypothetical protein